LIPSRQTLLHLGEVVGLQSLNGGVHR
jgi:hypothetical protein